MRLLFSFLIGVGPISAQTLGLYPFEPNSGHYPAAVHFIRRAPDNTIYLTRDAVVLPNQIRIQMAPLDPDARPQGETPSSAVFNVYQGRNSASWRTNAPMFEAIRWPAIFPGASARFTLGTLAAAPTTIGRGILTLQFQPGADLTRFRLRVLNTGTTPIIGPSGIWFVGGRVPGVFSIGAQAVQVDGQARRPIPGSLKIESADTLSLDFSDRNPALPTEVEISFPSYDTYRQVPLAPPSLDGNRYITSTVEQPVDFGPDGRLDAPGCNGRCTDVVVARIDEQGKPIWVTRFGGQQAEEAGFAKASAAGVALAGTTSSPDLPVSAGAPVSTLPSATDVFLASFDPGRGQLRSSTYAGSEGTSWIYAADVDPGGDLVVGGASYQGGSFESASGYLLRWNPATNRFVFSHRFDVPVTSLAFTTGSRIYFTLLRNVPGQDALFVGLLDAGGALQGSVVPVDAAPADPDTPIANVRLLPVGDQVWIVYESLGVALKIAKAAPGRDQNVLRRLVSHGGTLDSLGFTPTGNLKLSIRTVVPTETTTFDAPLVAACPDTLYFTVLSPSLELVHATYLAAAGLEFDKRNEPAGPPPPALGCLANSAGRRPSLSAAPGQLITLTGGGFGPSDVRFYAPDAAGKYPLEADGYRVRIDGQDAPIIALARGLIAVQVPFELVPGSDQSVIEVFDRGRPLDPLPFRYAPEFLDFFDTGQRETRSNLPVLAALNQDGTVNSRPTPRQ